MIRNLLLGIAFGLLLSTVLVRADVAQNTAPFSLELDPTGIQASETAAIQGFLDSVSSLLPEGLKQGIGRKIRVRFSSMGDQTKLELPVCMNTPSPDAVSSSKKAKMEILGHDSFGGHASVVDLNDLLKQEILAGPNSTRTYPCGHKTMYRLAMATLIHELAHVFDADQGTQESIQNKYFQKLMGFTRQWDLHSFLFRGTDPKNHLLLRSPDPYEFTNIKESFAVNVEYFVLDPEFPCRRPIVDHYLRGIFGVSSKPSCQMDTTVFENSDNAALNLQLPLNLDPSRIYDVHYLLASKGDAMMSRWGHAMYRLIVCAPERKTVGPECLQDVQYHVILSYRANIQDLVLSYVKGLTGGYPSQLYVLPLPEILTEYNKLELRDLISLPLHLTEDQKNQFIYRAIEQYWEYQGRYYFFTNNCATEALNFLQGIVPDGKIQELHDMTPIGLEDDLKSTGLIDESLLTNRSEAISEGYFFASKHAILDSAFEMIKEHIPELKISDSDSYMHDTTPEERRAYFDAVVKSTSGEDHIRMAASFYLLESYISSFVEKDISQRAFKKLADIGNSQGDARQNLDFVKALQTKQPWSKLSQGYGVPLATDFISDGQKSDDSGNKNAAFQSLQNWIKNEFKDDLAEFQKIEENKASFRHEIVAPQPFAIAR